MNIFQLFSFLVVGNSWGICENGTGAIGCGAQENFRGCSDIRVLSSGRGKRSNNGTPTETPRVSNSPADDAIDNDKWLLRQNDTKQNEILGWMDTWTKKMKYWSRNEIVSLRTPTFSILFYHIV